MSRKSETMTARRDVLLHNNRLTLAQHLQQREPRYTRKEREREREELGKKERQASKQ